MKSNNKPMIRRNEETGKIEVGYLDVETGLFSPVSEVEKEEEVKDFLKAYGLSVVLEPYKPFI